MFLIFLNILHAQFLEGGGGRESFPRKIPSSISMYYFTTETRLGSFTDIDIPELQNIPYVKMNAARLNMIV